MKKLILFMKFFNFSNIVFIKLLLSKAKAKRHQNAVEKFKNVELNK
jgi:hypothetical protein